MAFEIGHPRCGGRKKGTPNRNSGELSFLLRKEKFNVVKELVLTIHQLEAPEKISALLQLLSYLHPKRKAIELQASVSAIEDFWPSGGLPTIDGDILNESVQS